MKKSVIIQVCRKRLDTLRKIIIISYEDNILLLMQLAELTAKTVPFPRGPAMVSIKAVVRKRRENSVGASTQELTIFT